MSVPYHPHRRPRHEQSQETRRLERERKAARRRNRQRPRGPVHRVKSVFRHLIRLITKKFKC